LFFFRVTSVSFLGHGDPLRSKNRVHGSVLWRTTLNLFFSAPPPAPLRGPMGYTRERSTSSLSFFEGLPGILCADLLALRIQTERAFRERILPGLFLPGRLFFCVTFSPGGASTASSSVSPCSRPQTLKFAVLNEEETWPVIGDTVRFLARRFRIFFSPSPFTLLPFRPFAGPRQHLAPSLVCRVFFPDRPPTVVNTCHIHGFPNEVFCRGF